VLVFDLEVMGSSVIERLSRHLARSQWSLLEEMIENSGQAYRGIKAEQLEKEQLERAVVLSRQRHANGSGRLFIEDNGVGHTLNDRGSNTVDCPLVRLSACDPGLRRTLSWAILGAGSRVVIESTRKHVAARFRFEIDVRKVYEKLSFRATLDDILLDSKCTLLSLEDAAREDHGTILEIHCDRSRDIVNGYPLNRIYELTEPDEANLSQMLAEKWTTPGSQKSYARKNGHPNCLPPLIYVDGRAINHLFSVRRPARSGKMLHPGHTASAGS
jgi:hypothetical protein